MSELKQFDEFMDALVNCDTVKVILTGLGESVFDTKTIYDGIKNLALESRAGHSGGANGMINEPLTLEELMDMDGEPVCVLWPGGEVFWCLCHEGWITPPSCIPFAAEDCPRCTFYSQKPEGGAG